MSVEHVLGNVSCASLAQAKAQAQAKARLCKGSKGKGNTICVKEELKATATAKLCKDKSASQADDRTASECSGKRELA